MGTMIIEDQTGIQASPIQHLTTIFLGSSYRKSTWTIDPLIQVLFELNSHHILLHSSLHIVEVLHLLWLVIIPQRATTPSPYLRVQWKLVLRRWKQHFVTLVLLLLNACCHLKVNIFMVLNKTGWNFKAAPAQQQHTCHSWSQAFTLQLSIIMLCLWNVTRVFLSSSNYAAPISFGRVQLYVGPNKSDGSKKCYTQENVHNPTNQHNTQTRSSREQGEQGE